MKSYIIILVLLLGLFGVWFINHGNQESVEQANLDLSAVTLATSSEVTNINVPTGTSTIATTSTTTINKLNNQKKIMHATLHTNKGDIAIEFYEADAPNTVANFIKLAQAKFYDGIKFHRVIKGFMIQGGDPLTKDDAQMSSWGTGGPGYKFADELDPNTPSAKEGYKRGVVAMANSGPNTNGSQFFIMHADYALPHSYTIFGKVTSGLETVDKIANVATAPGDRPVEAVVINSVTLN